MQPTRRCYALDARGFFLWAAQVDDNVATRPVVTRGIVSFASEGGTAYGFDATTGKQRWKRRLDASSVASPTVVDDTIVFGSDGGTIRAFDIDDGGGRWSRSAQGSVEGALSSDSEGFVYVADGRGGVTALAADTGATKWQVTENDTFRTGPSVIGGLVVVVGDSGSVYGLDITDGHLVWAHTGGFVGPAAETGGHIALARSNGTVDEVDPAGALVHEFPAAAAVAPTDPAPEFSLGVTAGGGAVWTVDQGTVVRRLGPGAGGLTALQARWVHPFNDPPFSGAGFPTTVGELDGKAVLIDSGGAVYLVDPSTGDAQRIGDDPNSNAPPGGEAVVDGNQLFMTLAGALPRGRPPEWRGAMDRRWHVVRAERPRRRRRRGDPPSLRHERRRHGRRRRHCVRPKQRQGAMDAADDAGRQRSHPGRRRRGRRLAPERARPGRRIGALAGRARP